MNLIQVIADRDTEAATGFDHGEDRSHTRGTIPLALPQPLAGFIQILVLFCKAEAQQILAATGAEKG